MVCEFGFETAGGLSYVGFFSLLGLNCRLVDRIFR